MEEDINWISLEHAATSLRDVIYNGTQHTATNLTIAKWKSLLKDSKIGVSNSKVSWFLFRPSQFYMKQNAHCVDKHFKLTYSLKLLT